MGLGGRGAVLAWACGALLGCALLRAQDLSVWVELSCSIAADAGLASGRTLLVELRNPGGETIRQTFAHPGHSVRFRRLKPGILSACVTDRTGGCRCKSVDLYPPPEARTASFSVELKPPAPAAQAEQLSLVDKANLVIPQKARHEFGECQKDLRRGDMAEGVRHLERALAIHPEYPEAMSNLGSAYHMAGDYTRAAQLFERVTEIAPEMYAGWLNLGVTLLVTGEPRRALQAEMRALKLHPDVPFVLYQVGLCHYKLGEFAAARSFLERVIELDPCSATYPHLSLARIALAERHEDEAARLLREVSRLHPHAPLPPGMKEIVTQLARVPQR